MYEILHEHFYFLSEKKISQTLETVCSLLKEIGCTVKIGCAVNKNNSEAVTDIEQVVQVYSNIPSYYGVEERNIQKYNSS